jgi:peptidoglycan/LPS O-acetylase OafA/YrhL
MLMETTATTSDGGASKSRQIQLDSVRAISLAMVVVQHTMRPTGRIFGSLGGAGLMVFFVLSGYLISGLLLEARERADAERVPKGGVLRRFYIRRFLRIFPLYYAVLAIATLIGEPTTRQYLFQLATYQTNFLMAGLGKNLPPVTPLWSLAVEEHFYLFWPLIVLFGSRRFVWASVGVMVLGSVVSRAWAASLGGGFQAVVMPTWASVDGIALGCALALLFRYSTAEVRVRWMNRSLVAGLVLGLAWVIIARSSMPGRYVIVSAIQLLPVGLVSFWVIDKAVEGRLPRLFDNRVLGQLGLMSYGMYVLHRYVMHYLGLDYERGLTVFVAVFGVSAAIAFVSWHLFESPINNLKRFWPYVPRRAPVAATAGAVPGLAPVTARELVAPPDPVRK